MIQNQINIQNIDAVLFDLDGTLYVGSKILPGSNNIVNYFKNAGKKVFFTTNNSTKTREQIYERLVKLGIDAELEEVVTSGYIAANYALKTGMKDIHVFGSVNLIHEFQGLGIKVNQNIDAENLIIGYDPEMTYEDLTRAVRVAINAKCVISCNKEKVYPGENGLLFPGCGAMVAPVEWCSGRKSDLVIGKPNTMFVDYIKEKENITSEKILVIGDTYESDVMMAIKAGTMAILIGKEEDQNILSFPSVLEIYYYFKGQVDSNA